MKRFPLHFFIGGILLLIAWIVSWSEIHPYSYYTFFFIWIGFVLFLDGANAAIAKTSLLRRNIKAFLFLFLISAIFWWYFELVVGITQNWYYIISFNIPESTILFFGTLSFATVIPAVCEIAELIVNIRLLPTVIPCIQISKKTPYVFIFLGVLCFILPILRADIFYGLIWISLYFILDAINYLRGADSLLRDAMKNNWSRIFTFALAALVTGFFWEMWNYYADPRWFYETPYIVFLKVFEMPALGFIGYLPFGLEIFAIYSFFQGMFHFPSTSYFLLSKESAETPKDQTNGNNVLLILCMIIILTTIVLYFVEGHNISTLQGDTFVHPITQKITTQKTYSGTTYLCIYAIYRGYCLETSNRTYYLLVNTHGDEIQTDIGKVKVVGTIIPSQLPIGVPKLAVQAIYKQ